MKKTESLCPVCLKTLPATIEQKDDETLLCRVCPEHGAFAEPIWRGTPSFQSWTRPKKPHKTVRTQTEHHLGCPRDCGRCPDHAQQACTVLFEITDACNLHCPVCFASSQAAGKKQTAFTPLDTLTRQADWIHQETGPIVLQLSGGEPTLHPALLPLVTHCSRLFPAVQLNTNGLLLAERPELAHNLVKAGLSWVFLQFDGTTDDIYTALRGRPLLQKKMQALEHCKEAGLPVVFVPTVVQGVNDTDLGNILRLALSHAPLVRGVHLQPMTRSGRNAFSHNPQHLTLPEVLQLLCRQSDGLILEEHASPPGCEHERCAFHCRYRLMPDGTLLPMRKQDACCGEGKENTGATPCPSPFSGLLPGQQPPCCSQEPEDAKAGAERSIATVIRSWQAPQPPSAKHQDGFDAFIANVRSQTFSVTCMAFQDAWTADLERLRGCCVHVYAPPARLIPFCAFNMTSKDGAPLHRTSPQG